MSETSDTAVPTGGSPGEAPPSREQRMALVGALQAQALRRPDPLAANLGVIAGDLMGFAHGLAAAAQAGLADGAASAEARRSFLHNLEVYLKVVRQIDRLAQLERQPPPPRKGEGKGASFVVLLPLQLREAGVLARG